MAVHLVIAEHENGNLKQATRSVVAAAKQIDGEIHGLLLGSNVKQLADDFAKYVGKVHLGDDCKLEHRLAQPFAKVIADVASSIGATHIWAAASIAGKDIMPRVAARLNAGMASDIMKVVDEKTFDRPMWAGDIVGCVEITTATKVITVRTSEFDACSEQGGGEVLSHEVAASEHGMEFVKFDAVKSERPELSDADVIVSGGRGLKDSAGFKKIIEPLADELNAAIGASRAVCDAGWVPNDWQVGQTGKVVAPKLYFAIGISGAIQHIAGMKSSKCIVAINKDADAPIFQVADYGLVADAFEVVPQILEKIKNLSN